MIPRPFAYCVFFNDGLTVSGHHVQVLRNKRVGKTCNGGWLRSTV